MHEHTLFSALRADKDGQLRDWLGQTLSGGNPPQNRELWKAMEARKGWFLLACIELDRCVPWQEIVDQEKVDLFVEKIRTGSLPPPLILRYEEKSKWLNLVVSEGHHRLSAMKTVGWSRYHAIVELGTEFANDATGQS